MPFKDPDDKNYPMIRIFPAFQPMRVKYKDVFDLKGFYEALHEWLLENGWKDKATKLDYWENYYGERIAQGGMREIWIQWRPWKIPNDDMMLEYYLDFDWHCIAVTNTEIVRDGKKIKLNKGEVELKIRAYIEKTYERKLTKPTKKELEKMGSLERLFFPLIRPFLKLFTKRAYKNEIELRKKELYQETYAMQNFIKQWFKMKRYLPYEESKTFFTSQAFPSHLRE
jgi:hypothetical protein